MNYYQLRRLNKGDKVKVILSKTQVNDIFATVEMNARRDSVLLLDFGSWVCSYPYLEFLTKYEIEKVR